MSIRAQYIGRWIDNTDNIDVVKLRTYLSSPELVVDAGIGRNTVIVEDTISKHMIIIVSGMFPFSNIPDRRVTELIDYILPMKSVKAKNLNIILSNLAQIQACPNTNPVEAVKRWAQFTLDIIRDVPGVLEGTDIDFDMKSDFQQKLESMAKDGKKKGLAIYLRKIKT